MSDPDQEAMKWPGCWPGTVVSTEDPDKIGRIQVRVDQIYGSTEEDEFIADDDLPWARPCFPTTGLKSGEFHVPPVGSTVWVMFWGGALNKPVWLGGWFTPDDIPSEVVYDKTPRSKVIKTENGHLLEMQWKKDAEVVRLKSAGGSEILLSDPSSDGPRVDINLPGGTKATLDEKLKKIELALPSLRRLLIQGDTGNEKILLETPTRSILLDDTAGTIKITSTGKLEIQTTGQLLQTIGAAATLMFSATVSIIAAAAYSLTASAITLTGATVSLVGTVVLGTAGPKFKLIDDRFIAFFNSHVHGTTPVVSTPPITPLIPNLANTINTSAN